MRKIKFVSYYADDPSIFGAIGKILQGIVAILVFLAAIIESYQWISDKLVQYFDFVGTILIVTTIIIMVIVPILVILFFYFYYNRGSE